MKLKRLYRYIARIKFYSTASVPNSTSPQSLKGNNTPEAVNLRSLCVFLAISLKKWEANPAAMDAKLSKRQATPSNTLPLNIYTPRHHISHALCNSLPVRSSWDTDPKIAKLEKIFCTYYNTGIGDKVINFMKDQVEDHIKEEILEATIGPMLENLFAAPSPTPAQLDRFCAYHAAVWHSACDCAPFSRPSQTV
jgi:hypothetical protein